jgi:hypothetical protein
MRKAILHGLQAALCVLALVGLTQAQSSVMLVSVDQNGPAWADSHLYTKLADALTRDSRLRVHQIGPMTSCRSGKSAPALDLDNLLAAGQANGAQYVLYVRVSSERFERRKTFSVPLIFHKWEVIGVMEGEWRLVDVVHGRQICAAPIEIEMNGKRVIQATMDDNRDDPDINMTAPAKLAFFGQLEDRLVEQILNATQNHIGRQEREYVTRPVEKK